MGIPLRFSSERIFELGFSSYDSWADLPSTGKPLGILWTRAARSDRCLVNDWEQFFIQIYPHFTGDSDGWDGDEGLANIGHDHDPSLGTLNQ